MQSSGNGDSNAMHLLDNSKFFFKIWLANVKAGIIRESGFRLNFFLGIIRQGLWLGVFLIIIETIFHNTETLAGWDKAEVLIILALSRLIEGILDVFLTRNVAELPRIVQKGEFDFHLLKPVSAQLYTAFKRTNIFNIGNAIAGVILLIYGITLLDTVTPAIFALFFFLAILGMTIYYALIILTASIVFFTERLEALWGMLSLYTEPLTVPFDIFPRVPRIALSYVIPVAFLVFVPAQALTGRLQLWQIPTAIGIAALFLILANVVWRAGLRRYSSASS